MASCIPELKALPAKKLLPMQTFDMFVLSAMKACNTTVLHLLAVVLLMWCHLWTGHAQSELLHNVNFFQLIVSYFDFHYKFYYNYNS